MYFAPKQQKSNEGFTLVELLVALALFLVVMTIALGGLITMLDMNRKVHSLQVVMNGFNYTLESMTRDIRFGEKYTCDSEEYNIDGSPCPGGDSTMSVRFIELDGTWKNIAYRLQNSRIERCNEEVSQGDESAPGGVCMDEWVPISSQLIEISSLYFFVTGAATSPMTQPRVTMVINGVATVEGESTDFTLQTTVSQREFRNN
ncbi:MAG: prepilin-type N-terminal cleavage/methylation domain-containing protein [Candidatus Paceibacterota bacterium]